MLGYPFGWMIAAGLFFLLVLAIALSPVVIRGRIKRMGEDDDAELSIRALLGLVNFHWQLPEMKFNGVAMELKRELTAENVASSGTDVGKSSVNLQSIMKSIDWTQALLQHTDDLLGWVKKTLGHVRVTEWKWVSAVGTGDAMWTAMLTGTVWSAKTTVIGVLSQLIQLETDPELTVQPVFQAAYFSTEGKFTAKVSFGYAIFAGIRLAVKMKHAAAEGVPRGVVGWQRILLRG
ncbi:DUF2953 domain-containing protein [Paenibacillus lycopersici]|uniref:DUF2953 domain-containing protein n=1 Tax=Paenibacillus lycopersici TaxID=2704462 RepID=A0A6C0FWR9_9BACL|nr:DUF2953 domain-containing protein [Paenibacillus lycopersici]QHT60492.1 DUF2953 domain-containing protein [Paenibacillus lycopersici]